MPEEKKPKRQRKTRSVPEDRLSDFSPEQRAFLDHAISEEKQTSKNLDRQLKALRKELSYADKRLEVSLGIRRSDPPPYILSGKIPTIDEAKAETPDGEATLVFVASDWHVEEHVAAERVNDLNKYNPDVAWERCRHYFRSCLWLLRGNRHMAKIDNVVLAVLGDMITGYIHEELMEDNFMSPVEATRMVTSMLSEGIDYLLKHGRIKRLIIPCCHGNHGRTHPQKKIATAAKNSHEWLMYHVLADRYRNDSRVEFHVADGYHLYLQVYDTMIRFHHGDHVRYGGGIGGLTIPLNKRIDKWNRNIHANLDVLGHFHQMLDGGNFIVNGSLIGYNAYAISIGAPYEPPQQVAFLVRPGRGKSATFPVFVKDD